VLIYAIIGFILIQLPLTIVSLIYGGVPDCAKQTNLWSLSNPCGAMTNANLKGAVQLFGQILTWVNTFLTIITVILIIYTGVVVLMS
jgi:hypothetical protein